MLDAYVLEKLMIEDGKELIPICLVTGFLGSGKTTFLKQVVAKNRERKIVYLVNEFSPHDIDGAIVSKENPSVVSIPGGSIFCKCLVTEFIHQMSSIPTLFDGVEGIVIEASGMANPKVISDMLRETKLDDRYVLSHIISIVDPGSFMKLRVTLPNIVAQIEASDSVIINKTDLYGEQVVAETENALLEIKEDVCLYKAVDAKVELNLFSPPVTERVLHGDYAKCKDPNYESITIKVDRMVDIDELRSKILAIEDDIYRLKGYLLSDRGSLFVEYTKSGFTVAPVDGNYDSAIVIIMRGDASDASREFVAWLG